jgi:hypothetical protein
MAVNLGLEAVTAAAMTSTDSKDVFAGVVRERAAPVVGLELLIRR